jgi:uncharacterized protein
MSVINCHTHVFNNEYVPRNFARAFVPAFLANMLDPLLFNPTSEKILASILSRLGQRRLAAMLGTGSQRSQVDVFDILKSRYPEGTRFVFLPMNMDYTGMGDPDLHVKAQVDFLVDRFYTDLGTNVFVFIPVDPRAGDPDTLLQFVKDYINLKCSGIKIYPPLGFYPNDPRLRPVYRFAEANGIPITTHANKDGGFFYFPDKPDMAVLTPPLGVPGEFNANEPDSPTKRFQRSIDFHSKFNANSFRNNFMHPVNYYDVLKEFPKLKINFAHFGGAEDIKAAKDSMDIVLNQPVLPVTAKNSAGDFTRWIYHLCNQFDMTYTDVSYTLHDSDAIKTVSALMKKNPELASRILFGTDFYVVEKEKTGEDDALLAQARDVFKEDFDTISVKNPEAFLHH